MKKLPITLEVNEKEYSLEVAADLRLVDLLRDELGLLGTKEGCGAGECGACTVIMDQKTVNSCLVLAVQATGSQITTIEGIASRQELAPLQQAFIEEGAVQCGFCTPGMILAAYNLLARNPNPSREEIKAGLAGNICRCTGYIKIFAAVQSVAAQGVKSCE